MTRLVALVITGGLVATGLLTLVDDEAPVPSNSVAVQVAGAQNGAPRQTSSLSTTEEAQVARAATALIDAPAEVDVVKGAGAEVLAILYPGERVFGDDQGTVASGDLLVMRVVDPTKVIDYPRPPGVELRRAISVLLVLKGDEVVASQLGTEAIHPAEQLDQMKRIGPVGSVLVDPSRLG